MANLFIAPTVNYKQTTLNGAIDDSVSTITLNSVTNLQFPGYIVVDRTDSNGVSTPSAREVISYTGISGNNLTGCTRGADNSTAQAHSDAAVVETMPTIGMWNSLATIMNTAIDSNSYLRAINSPVSIARGQFTQIVTPSVASITEIRNTRAFLGAITVATSINASGASVVGFGGTGGLNALFQVPGGLASIANIGGLVPIPASFTLQFMEAFVQTPASVASVGIFLLKNSAVVGTVHILGGNTYASSASFTATSLVASDVLTMDIRSNASLAQDLSLLVRAT